jgi:hypothetical protein
MAAEDPIHRGEFNAAMHGLRESIDGLKESVTRVEAKQDMASGQALEFARESGRTEARLEQLEKQQRADRSALEAQQKEDRETAEARSTAVAAAAEDRAKGQDLWIRGTILLVLAGGLAFVLRLLEGVTR